MSPARQPVDSRDISTRPVHEGVDQMAAKHSLFSTDVAALSLRTLGANSRLNLIARSLLLVFSLTTAALAVVYVVVRSNAIVDILLKPRIPGDEIAGRLVALGAPVLLLGGFALLPALAAARRHSRSLHQSGRTLGPV